MKKTLQLKGLDCAACAGELEEMIANTEGVKACSVLFVTQKLTIEYKDEKVLEKVKDIANHFEEVQVVEASERKESMQGDEKVIKIKNLHCAACAMELQEELEKLKGVKEVSVDFISQSVRINIENEEALRKAIKSINHFEKVKVVDEENVLPKKESHTKEIVQIFVAAVLFLSGILIEHLWVKDDAANNFVGVICMYVVYAIAYFSVGSPVLISTGKNIIKGKIFDENFLMTIASVGAMVIGQFGEGVAVMLLYQIGEFLQGIAVGSSRRSISELMNLRSEIATLIRGEEQIKVKPEELEIGDIILVKAGEKIPVDGVVTEGGTSIDTKSLTGEAVPRDVKTGDEVLSGCINIGSNIYLRVIRQYTDSAVAKILDLVENSTAKKAEPEKFITKFAKYYTPIVCILAVCIAICVPLGIGLATGEFIWNTWKEWIVRALSLLVISCPCALIISVPLTYFGGIGAAARYGVLVKGATYLDKITYTKVAAFDKTGTLTEGNFEIVNVSGDEDTLAIAAAAERGSSHPLAKPFEKVQTTHKAENVKEVAGKGVCCTIDGKEVLVGNAFLLKESDLDFPLVESVSTVIYVAKDKKFIGYIEIDDKVKQEAKDALSALKQAGVEKCVMITGDNPARAKKIADELGEIDEVYAGLMPDAKLAVVEKLKENGTVLYAGDGINDAPVMSVSDCAFSMGKLGSGAAIEASDFVIISDNLSAIPTAVHVAKKTRKIVTENITFSILAKVAFMALCISGVLPLWLAVFGDVGVMLVAVLNSMRMRLNIKE